MRRKPLLILFLFILAGCSSMKPENFAGREPKLVLEAYFLGRSKAWGIFEDRFGNLRRQFTVDIVGSMEGETLVLEEDFLFDDGEVDRRVWRITRTGEHSYSGTAGDVIGTAEGAVFGNALNWNYRVNLKVGERTTVVRFNDWMFQQDEDVMINRAIVTKFGLRVGEVTIFFRRLPNEVQAARSQAAARPRIQRSTRPITGIRS